ncbi:MAG: hypothetical protein R6U02_06660, partial [Alkalibacterium sp.]
SRRTSWCSSCVAMAASIGTHDFQMRDLFFGKSMKFQFLGVMSGYQLFAFRAHGTLTSNPRDILFIDRLVADSRSVALNHAAGLSAPQQVMMTLFSLYALLDTEDEYKKEVMGICQTRGELLYESLEMSIPYKSLNTAYYCEIDFDWWMEKRYSLAFKTFVEETWTMTDIVTKLAEEERLMLLKAEAFGSSKWTVRVSLANLETKAYKEIGKRVSTMMDRLYTDWKNN